MSKTIRVTLTDTEYTELLGLAARERRTVNNQAAVMLHELLPTLRLRRSTDVQKSDTHPIVPGPTGAER